MKTNKTREPSTFKTSLLCLAGRKNICEHFGNMKRVHTKMMHMGLLNSGERLVKKIRGYMSFSAAESSSKNYQVNCCLLAFLSPLSESVSE